MAQRNKPDHLGRLDTWLSLGQWLVKGLIALTAFGLPAWAARATGILADYAPFSWVSIGILGAMVIAGAYAIWGWGRQRHRRATYDKKMFERGSYVDPLEKTFERKRIFLNEFAMPSHPLIEGKTFIDCEIIGPANVVLQMANRVDEPKFPICDTVLMGADADPRNGYLFRSCTFRGCSFQRITFLIPETEYEMAKDVDWLNWITDYPKGDGQLKLEMPSVEETIAAMIEPPASDDDNDKLAK